MEKMDKIFKNRECRFAIVSALISILVMSLVERLFQPSYAIKSLIKILVMNTPILLHTRLFHRGYFDLIYLKRKKLSKTLVLAMAFAYIGIIVAFLLFQDMIDLSLIRKSLFEKEGLTRENFLFVFVYIIIVNSFLEESFFRGYLSHVFMKRGFSVSGKIFSAFLFSIYHIGIVSGWFNILIFVIMIIGLSLAGLFLQYVADKEDTLSGSWMVHACANLAINTIGTIMMLK